MKPETKKYVLMFVGMNTAVYSVLFLLTPFVFEAIR
jgi:hypothetical protein